MRTTRIFGFLLLPLLMSCATLPHYDPGAACHIPTRNEAMAVQLMKAENEAVAGTPFLGGNHVVLLENGPETYAAMQQAITAAHTRIDMESYEFDGDAAKQFAASLLAAQARGVQVNLIYDAWGSKNQPQALFDQLTKGGVHVVEYSPFDITKLKTLDLNKRDHRKLLVIDNRVVFTGGVNIAQFYENSPGIRVDNMPANANTLPWRDTDVEITGPVVGTFETLFLQTWTAQGGKPLPPPPAPPVFPRGDTVVQAIDGAPGDGHPAIYDSLLTAIATAHKTVHLTTGFFAPPPELQEALECAAERGVDVKIIVPGASTSDSTITAGRSHYTELLAAGVKIYERQGVVLHAKTAVIDGIWSVVGSSNLDWRSVVYNNEIDAVIIGHGFAGKMEVMFAQDIAASHQVTPQAWAHRGLFERLNEARARMVESLL
jgi:cardiolipin synthase